MTTSNGAVARVWAVWRDESEAGLGWVPVSTHETEQAARGAAEADDEDTRGWRVRAEWPEDAGWAAGGAPTEGDIEDAEVADCAQIVATAKARAGRAERDGRGEASVLDLLTYAAEVVGVTPAQAFALAEACVMLAGLDE